MESTVELFLERQRRSDSRTAVFIINGDIDILDDLVQQASLVDADRVAEIMDTDSIDSDAVANLYLTSHTYRATYLGAIVNEIVRVPHPTVASIVASLDSAMEFCQWQHVAWLVKRCYRHDEIRMVFEVASLPDPEAKLISVSKDVYNCMPMGWALDKALGRRG